MSIDEVFFLTPDRGRPIAEKGMSAYTSTSESVFRLWSSPLPVFFAASVFALCVEAGVCVFAFLSGKTLFGVLGLMVLQYVVILGLVLLLFLPFSLGAAAALRKSQKMRDNGHLLTGRVLEAGLDKDHEGDTFIWVKASYTDPNGVEQTVRSTANEAPVPPDPGTAVWIVYLSPESVEIL